MALSIFTTAVDVQATSSRPAIILTNTYRVPSFALIQKIIMREQRLVYISVKLLKMVANSKTIIINNKQMKVTKEVLALS